MYKFDPIRLIMFCYSTFVKVYFLIQTWTQTFATEQQWTLVDQLQSSSRGFFFNFCKTPEVMSVKELKLVLFTVPLNLLQFSSCGLISMPVWEQWHTAEDDEGQALQYSRIFQKCSWLLIILSLFSKHRGEFFFSLTCRWSIFSLHRVSRWPLKNTFKVFVSYIHTNSSLEPSE